MTTPNQEERDWENAIRRGAFEVYGPLGMGINIEKLIEFIDVLLQSTREETREEIVKLIETEFTHLHGGGNARRLVIQLLSKIKQL